MGRKKYVVELTEEEREILEKTARKGSGGKSRHAYILLKASENWKDERIAEAYNVSVSTIERVRQRFVEEGLEAALSRKPTSRVYRRKIEGEEEAHLIALACSDPPEGRAEWTMQLLADKMVELNYVESISDETIRRVLNKNELKPWQKKNGASRRSKMPPSSAKWKRS
jgi:transposase